MNWLNRSYACNKEIRLTLEDQVKALTLSRFSHFFIFSFFGVLSRESRESFGEFERFWVSLGEFMRVWESFE